MSSVIEHILNALQQELLNVAPCLRNAALPERVGSEGLIILRDGTPTLHDSTLGGLGETYYTHEIEVEIYIQEMDSGARDQAFDILLMRLGNGLIFGMHYSRPSVETESVEGASAIKHGTLTVTVEYAAPSPLC